MSPTELTISCDDASQLGRSLKIWRMLRHIKQHHAAQLLGVSQTTVSRWENGRLTPTSLEQALIRDLLTAQLDSAADQELARLVSESRAAVHLVCDLTHQLLAVSRTRERQWRVSGAQMLGSSLWRYATDEIVQAEAGLSTRGWYERSPPALLLHTGANRCSRLPIRAGWMRWVRFQLSDGSFARLVEAI